MAENKEKAAPAEAAPPEKSSKKTRLLIVAGLVGGLVLGGGGVAAFFIFGPNAGSPKPEPISKPVVDEEGKPVEPAIAYVKLTDLSAPMISKGRILAYVLLDLSLEVDGADEAQVTEQLPALQAAFLIEVTQRPVGKPDQPLVIDYEGVTKRLAAVANRELKGPVVKQVLVTQSTRM